MKKIIALLALTGILASCNQTKTENTNSAIADSKTEKKDSIEKANETFVKINSDEALVATALMAAPEESREGCTVIGYNMAGEFDTLKKGDNQFICLADDPKEEGFSAACYHKSLEPFMARGRELKREGKSHKEIFDIREAEAKSGKLKMGNPGATLQVYYSAKAMYNPKTNKVDGAQYRYVVYIPWATSESTGLPETPVAPNHPWIMDPGTHRAHIMINPLKGDDE